MHSLKVLTVNVHKGFAFFRKRFMLRELREALRKVGADLVFLQEVLGEHELHAKRIDNWPAASQYEFLADELWPHYAYGKNAIYPEGNHGNALLSKFPIVGYENVDVTLKDDEQRGMLHAVIRLLGSHVPLHVMCVHLSLSARNRGNQLRLLCDSIQKRVPADVPLVVAGDFNDWRIHAHPVLSACAGLQEVFDFAHGAAARTFPAYCPLLRLDRIYVRNASAHRPIALSKRPWSQLSDHLPLAAEVYL